MFWFDRDHPEALFCDIRDEEHWLTDASSPGGKRHLRIAPDMVADFTNLPFADNSFPLIVFDPPHLVKAGRNSWLAKKYGKLGRDWREDIASGFRECFRVLSANGTLIFKWNENDIPVSQIVELSPHAPLFGNRNGKLNKSHWLVFMKPAQRIEARSDETLQAARPEGQEPDGEADAPNP
ncbi:class I SAM-dependent methyltransferase [Qipengyuania flava]|uniref:class I SAM-dependent methyltransferase n=1 Tax=Qipengyuania flava TaxID=192812 RepID=UPI001E53D057|nr:class I SAM-dependent methyltransferase [Qipengyuania flava]